MEPSGHRTTTTSGGNSGDNHKSIAAEPRGPFPGLDHQLLEKLAHKNREHIPERTVHATISGAYGLLTVTHDISRWTKAALFSQVGKQTNFFLRMAEISGERDVRGFALKFYTGQGNWDLVGNNTSVFFVRDALQFRDFIHSQKRHPRTNLRSNTAMWHFWSQCPESLHQVTILMSDRGLPRSFRFMHGFGAHTFSFLNAKDERFWVKFHFKTMQGIQCMTNAEAAQIIAMDCESFRIDLFESIDKGDFPKWKMQVQIMPEIEAETYRINPFDVTKVWPHNDYPLHDVGILELNRNPDDYVAEVERSSFSPSNIVSGIGFSPDKLLQARLFSGAEDDSYRTDTHHEMLPGNCPISMVDRYNADGSMRFDSPEGTDAYYEPNRFNGLAEDEKFREPPLKISGDADHYNRPDTNDDFKQPGDLFRLLPPDEKERLFKNIADSMEGVPENIVDRQMELFRRADPAYAEGVAKALGFMDRNRPAVEFAG